MSAQNTVGRLSKITSYASSISLTQAEFETAWAGGYEAVDVTGRDGKKLKTVTKEELSRRLKKAQIILVNDDPDNKHYWVVNV